MFWRKKPAKVDAEKGKAEKVPGPVEMPEMVIKQAEKPKTQKLPGPKDIDELVGRYVVLDKHQNPDYVWRLKSVVRRWPENKNRFDFRIFDDAQAATKKAKIRDYTSLDSYPELILWEGWADNNTNTVTFRDKTVKRETGKTA